MTIQKENIPTFKFNSKELAEFKAQFMEERDIHFNSNAVTSFSNRINEKGTQTVWVKSDVKYIVDHGSFKTLETSIYGQQHTHSVVLD